MRKLIIGLSLLASLTAAGQAIPNVAFPTTEPSPDTYTVNITNYGSSYNDKVCLVAFRSANSGPATLNITPTGGSALGAKPLRKFDGTDWVPLSSGDIIGDSALMIIHYSANCGCLRMFASGSSSAGSVTSITFNTPLTGGVITSTGSVGITNAAADGSTKGAASFTAADFDASSGNVSIDYTNGQAASGSNKGFLTSTDWTTFNGKGSGTVTNIATTSPLTGGPITGTGTIAINDAAADGSTKGAASFTAVDFDATSGNIGIDYTNGQKATGSIPGFLLAADWNTFNGKQDALGYIPLNPASNLSDVANAGTSLQNLGGLEKSSTANTQTGDYTLQVSDFSVNTTIYMNSSSPHNLTIPLNATAAIPVGRTVLGRRIGSASITFVATGGVTLISAGGSANDPGRYYLFALTKTATDSWYLDNGGTALGSANQLLGVDNAGSAQEYKTVSEGLTSASGTLQIGGAITSDKTFTGGFNWGFGVSPVAKLTVRGVGTGTGSLGLFEDSGGTDRFLILDNGKVTWVSAQSGAGIVGFSGSASLTSTANSQTMTGYDWATTVGYGGFTGVTAIPFRFRDTAAANDYWNVTISTSGASTAQNFNSAGIYNFRNTNAVPILRADLNYISLRGGTATSTKSIELASTVASSTNNHIFLNLTGNIHNLGTSVTRTLNAVTTDFSVTSVDGSTITYNYFDQIPSFSVGNSALTINGPTWNPSITGTGTIFNYAFRTLSGMVGIRNATPTAYIHMGAGSTAANSAPLKFTSGSLQTTAEAGAVEFLTDKLYATITTGAARKEISLNDAALTSGTFPVATTNGRLTDSGLTTSNLKAIYSGGFSGSGTATTTYTVTIGPTLGATTYEVAISPTNALSAALFYVNNKTTTTFDVVYLSGLTGTVAFDWIVTP